MARVAWHFGPGSDIGPTYDQGILKGPRMVDHVRLMTVCQSKSSDLLETHLLLFSKFWRCPNTWCPNTCRRGFKKPCTCSKYCWFSTSIKAHNLFHRWCLSVFMSRFLHLPLTHCWMTAAGRSLRLLRPMAHSGRCAAALVISRRSLERLGAPAVSYENEILFWWNMLDPKRSCWFLWP